MNVEVFILDDSRWECSNRNCKHSPDYHFNIIGSVFRMKAGFPCLEIMVKDRAELYCYECIDDVYKKIKVAFDKKLWILK